MAFDYGLGSSIQSGDQSISQTAAGSSQSDATLLIADYVAVTTFTAGQGVRLPPLEPKEIKMVFNNDSADSLLVYPASGCAINGGSSNAPLTLAARHGAMFIGMTSTVVGAIYG